LPLVSVVAITYLMAMTKTFINVQWIDFDGSINLSRLRSEFDAVLFEESLDAEGLSHNRF
jgi:hypothetical protein